MKYLARKYLQPSPGRNLFDCAECVFAVIISLVLLCTRINPSYWAIMSLISYQTAYEFHLTVDLRTRSVMKFNRNVTQMVQISSEVHYASLYCHHNERQSQRKRLEFNWNNEIAHGALELMSCALVSTLLGSVGDVCMCLHRSDS